MAREVEMVEVDHVEQRFETAKAYGVTEGEVDDDGKEVIIWLPKSQVQKEGNVFHVPEWLAKEKGLI